jgi:hypothetical protein
MNDYIKNWKEFLITELKDPGAGYEYQSFEIHTRIKKNKDIGGDKYETIGEIRSIPGVTVVSYLPGSGTEDATNYYDTLRIKFCCTRSVRISPRSYANRMLRKEINKINGIHVLKFVGRIRRVA